MRRELNVRFRKNSNLLKKFHLDCKIFLKTVATKAIEIINKVIIPKTLVFFLNELFLNFVSTVTSKN